MTTLRAYRPRRSRPWDRAAAARFLRRAGFAPSPDEVEETLALGPAKAAESVVRSDVESERARELDALGEALAVRSERESTRLAGWWLQRMTHTRRPFRERLLVFWHDHFATSHAKVRRAPLMLAQLRTLEAGATGRFEDLLRAVSRDPAMIVWLDGDENGKGRPNENYARELFELFTLGVGEYTETDVREAARAFTGWHQRNGRFRFVKRAHDDGRKTVLGVTGPLDGDDVIRAVLRHPACASRLARKLLEEFVMPSPPDDVVDAVAKRLRETEYDIAATLETLFASEVMHDPARARSRILSPVELVVGLVRSLGLEAGAATLERWTSRMGQRLFEPPSVAGWPGHRAWLDSATLLARIDAAVDVSQPGGDFEWRVGAVRAANGIDDRGEALAYCRSLAFDGDVPRVLDARLRAMADKASLDDTMREAMCTLVGSPEYQFV